MQIAQSDENKVVNSMLTALLSLLWAQTPQKMCANSYANRATAIHQPVDKAADTPVYIPVEWASCSLAASKVFCSSMATVMGPTPPGTGVMADTT